MKVKRLIFPMLVLLLLLSECSNVSQTDYYNVQNELDRAQKKIDTQDQEISELMASKAALEEQVSVLEEQLETLNNQLNSYKDKTTEYEYLVEAELANDGLINEPKPTETPITIDDNMVLLGDSYIVSVQPHYVRSGNGKNIFKIGVCETTTEVMASISSEDLSSFIRAIGELTDFENVVLCFEDGTGIVFNRSFSSVTNDYGIIDVSYGNFEITKRLGAIWNTDGQWCYMTEEEMIAADEADW